VLYLYRRQQADTGGAGTFRGGVSMAAAYTPHDVETIPNVIFHGHGVDCPSVPGLYGGYPGGTNVVTVKRGTDVLEFFASGLLPRETDPLSGSDEGPQRVGRTAMQRGDVCSIIGGGPGGYGDPLDREPERVLNDVAQEVVSAEWAERLYGVVLRGPAGPVDLEATRARRQALREERRRRATLPAPGAPPPGALGPDAAHPDGRISPHLQAVSLRDGVYLQCRCGHVLGSAADGHKPHAAWADLPCQTAGPYCAGSPEFLLREFYCPGCFTLLDLEIVRTEQVDE
jgi:N-methylhydantoinase B